MAITFISREQELEFLERLWGKERLPLHPTKIGRWWRKKESDLLALDERNKKALFVEVKWRDLREREAKGILKDLRRKAGLVGLDGWGKTMG